MKLLIPLFVAIIPSAAWAQDVLRVYNWDEYIDPAVIESFEAEHGVKVDYHEFTTSAELFAGIDSDHPYDIVVPSHYMLENLVKAEKIQLIDTQRLERYANINPWSTQLIGSNAGQLYAIPYLWGTVGLAVNQSLAQQSFGEPVPNQWQVLFEAAPRSRLSECGYGLQDSPEEVLSIWFNYQGRRMKGASESTVRRNVDKLKPLVDEARTIDNEGLRSQLAERKLCAALIWSGDALLAKLDNPEISYDVPEEGSVGFIDTLAIPANARNPELAYRFIDHLLKPENMILNSLASMHYNFLVDNAPELRGFSAAHPHLTVNADQRRRTYFNDGIAGLEQSIIEDTWNSLKDSRN